jgi:hypothetical protein
MNKKGRAVELIVEEGLASDDMLIIIEIDQSTLDQGLIVEVISSLVNCVPILKSCY